MEQTLAVSFVLEFQREIVKTYLCLRNSDDSGYSKGMYESKEVLERARRELSKHEYALVKRAALYSVEAVRKCCALGLQNIEKRLAEYRFTDIVEKKSDRKKYVNKEESEPPFREVSGRFETRADLDL